MTISTIALSAPINPSAWPDHPALRFYATYGKQFSEHFGTTQAQDFYAASCKMHAVDQSVLEGGEVLWKYFASLYSAFPRVTRDFLTLIVVSDDEAGTHTIHIEIITTLYLDAQGERKVNVPQAFVYVLGKADEGKGTYGLQFRELRCYYDMSLIDKAKASL